MEQPIEIELKTIIKDGDQKEMTTIIEYGKIHLKDHMHLVRYEEKTENKGTINNMISIQPDKVSIRRSGEVKMNQLFREGELTENVFHHPYGRIHMETYTTSIDYEPIEGDKPGRLTIDYTVKLNGQDLRKHLLTLTLKG